MFRERKQINRSLTCFVILIDKKQKFLLKKTTTFVTRTENTC